MERRPLELGAALLALAALEAVAREYGPQPPPKGPEAPVAPKAQRDADARPFLDRVARLIEAASPEGLRLEGWPWAKYGKERVYIHVLDDGGRCLETGLFWEAGSLGWRFHPRRLPGWFEAVRAALGRSRLLRAG